MHLHLKLLFFIFISLTFFFCEKKTKIIDADSVKNDIEENIKYLEKALITSPDDDSLIIENLIFQYELANKNDKITTLLINQPIDKLTDINLLRVAKYYISNRNFSLANQYFTKVKNKKSDLTSYNEVKISLISNAKNRTIESDSTLLDSANAEFLYKLASNYLNKKDSSLAIKVLYKSITKESHLNSLKLLEKIYYDKKDFSKAIEYGNQVVKIDSMDAEVYFLLAFSHKYIGNRTDAIQYYEKAIMINPNFKEALYNLSILYLQRSNFNRAEKTLKKVELLEPNKPNLNFKIAISLEKQNKINEAIEYYKRILPTDENYETAQNQIKSLSIK